ncbi:MAG TPA: tail fiber protein [Silvibacterium sp.]|jgi:microcystin-dependent protein|nr:tail fiber protein [Silvibacterium sp.]
MSSQYLSEIRIMSFNFAPKGWAFCNGQLMAINQNQPLFALIGTYYGGNGQQNFALPNLQVRTPIHMGNGYALGNPGGEQNHTLSTSELPNHTHTWGATNAAANAPSPTSNLLGGAQEYSNSATNPVTMSSGVLFGTSQPHQNMQPYLTLNFCIALSGIFPSQN